MDIIIQGIGFLGVIAFIEQGSVHISAFRFAAFLHPVFYAWGV